MKGAGGKNKVKGCVQVEGGKECRVNAPIIRAHERGKEEGGRGSRSRSRSRSRRRKKDEEQEQEQEQDKEGKEEEEEEEEEE